MIDAMLPFKYENKDVEDECTYYWGCTFNESCGPFRMGERVGLLKLVFNTALLYDVDSGRNVILRITNVL